MTKIVTPTISFTHSQQTEALRVLYILARLTSQEYLTRGFFFLPNIPPHTTKVGRNRIILLPHCSYPIIPNLQATTPMSAPKEIEEQMIKLISPHYQNKVLDRFAKKIKSDWNDIYQDFFSRLFIIIPQYQNMLKRINIILTCFGTPCQFSLIDDKVDTLTVYLRSDQTVTELAEAIISSLIRPTLQYQYNYSWQEVESVIDFLLRDTYLKELFSQRSAGTIRTLRGQQLGKLQSLSNKYLTSLHLKPPYLWKKQGSQIFYQNKPLTITSPKHKILLEVMLAQAGQTVSFDELASSVWYDDKDYSLYALTKEISRLRKILKDQDVPSSCIQAHRKLGYSLK